MRCFIKETGSDVVHMEQTLWSVVALAAYRWDRPLKRKPTSHGSPECGSNPDQSPVARIC